VLDRDLNKTILTFAQANEQKILDALVEQHLEEAYINLRPLHPSLFKTEGGEWKPFKEVRDRVGSLLYSDLLQVIREDVQQIDPTLFSEVSNGHLEDLDLFYPKYRLYAYMHSALDDIKSVGEKSSFLLQPMLGGEEDGLEPLPSLAEQWKVVKKSQVFKKHEPNSWFTSNIFSMAEQSWSDLTLYEGKDLCFFQLKEKSVPKENFSTNMKQGQAILSKESKGVLMQEILELLKVKGAIHLYEPYS